MTDFLGTDVFIFNNNSVQFFTMFVKMIIKVHSIMYLLKCLLDSPKTNYKISTIKGRRMKEKQTCTHKDKRKKRGTFRHLPFIWCIHANYEARKTNVDYIN